MGQSETPGATFEKANTLYAQGNFAEAANKYQELLGSGKASAAVYFNLGNALFKAGQIGRAIAAYRKAEELTPRDPDLQANLRFARSRVSGPTLTIPLWQRAIGKLSLNEWTVATSAVVWICLLLLAAAQWRPALSVALRGYTVVSALLAGLLGIALALDFHRLHSPVAVVTSPDTAVRQAPLAESERVFTANDGAELHVIDRKGEWLQVSPYPNRSGWVKKDHLVEVNKG